MLSERATAARAETVWAGGTGRAAEGDAAGGTRLSRRPRTASAGTAAPRPGRRRMAGWLRAAEEHWSGRAIAALVIPALILLVVWLL